MDDSCFKEKFERFLSNFNNPQYMKIFEKYVYALMFYKYLSDSLEEYLYAIKNDDLILSEAYDKYYTQFKESSLLNLGYFINYEYLFSNLLYDESGNQNICLIDLNNALMEVSQSSKGRDSEKIFLNIFDNIDFLNPQLSKIHKDLDTFFINLMQDINSFNLNDDYSLAFEEVIYYFNQGYDKKLKISGNNVTIKEINDLISKLAIINVENNVESIYDPFLGRGMTLINIMNNCSVSKVYGQEINLDNYKISLMNLIIHGFNYKQLHIIFGDTIKEPGYLNETFDIIVSDPPIGIKQNLNSNDFKDRFKGFKIPKNASRFEFFNILHMVNNLSENGIIITSLPKGALSRNADVQIKEELIKNNYLDAVISLPGNTPYKISNEICLLVFKKNRKTREVLFIDASKEFKSKKKMTIFSNENINKIVDTYNYRVEIDKFSKLVSLDEITKNKFNLSISRYVNTFEGEFIKLNDVIEKREKLNKNLQEVITKIDDLFLELKIKK